MSQTAITAKHTPTVVTATTGLAYAVSGRDTNQIINWRGVVDAAVPAADVVLATGGSYTFKAGSQVNGWKSKTTLKVPIMETIASGDSIGYVAVPKVQAEFGLTLSIFRPSTMSQSVARQKLAEFGYMLFVGSGSLDAATTKLVDAIVGYTPADA